jgi:flagellar biosynthesis protein FliQ
MMPDRWDIMAVFGFVTLIAGIALVYIPAAMIIAGIILLAAAWIGAQRSSGE